MGRGTAERQDSKDVRGMIIKKKQGDSKVTHSKDGRFSKLIVGIYGILELQRRQPRLWCAAKGCWKISP